MSELEVNMATQHGNSTVQHGRTDGRTYEEVGRVTASLTSVTRAGGAKADDDAGVRFPVVRTGPRAEIPIDVRRGVYRRDGYRCHYCGISYDAARLDLDHMIPWSAGGSDASHNLRTLCQRCNETRSNYDDRERHKRVLPVTWWCLDCHGPRDEDKPWWSLPRPPAWVRPAPPCFEAHERLTFAYCATCDINGYTEVAL